MSNDDFGNIWIYSGSLAKFNNTIPGELLINTKDSFFGRILKKFILKLKELKVIEAQYVEQRSHYQNIRFSKRNLSHKLFQYINDYAEATGKYADAALISYDMFNELIGHKHIGMEAIQFNFDLTSTINYPNGIKLLNLRCFVSPHAEGIILFNLTN